MTVPLAPGGHWTIEDLVELPDDGNRYELRDGSLLVTPPPDLAHADCTDRLTNLLKRSTPDHLRTWSSGAGVQLRGGVTYYIPDIVVFPAAALDRATLALQVCDVVLVVEVVSKGNRRRDLVLKRNDYAAAGIGDYWIIDREVRSLTALSLGTQGSAYREEAVVRAGEVWHASRPFPVALDPARFC